MKVTTSIGKVIKTLGLMGIMMALAGLMVHAPAASAASASTSKLRLSTPGKLAVYVSFPATADVLPTVEVAVIDAKDTIVAKGTTDSNNSYSTSVPSGAYKVLVNAEGYKSSVTETKVASGQATGVKVALESNDPAPAPVPVITAVAAATASEEVGKLVVNVSNAKTGEVVSGATVIIYDAKGNGVAKGSVDSDGNFGAALEPGTYKVHVTARGYNNYSESVEVVAGQLNETKIGLSSTSSDTDPYIGPVIIR
jgi:uncharacterized membrane protein